MANAAQLKKKTQNLNGAAANTTDMDDVRAELETLKADFGSLLKSVSDIAKSKSNDGVEKGQEFAELAEEKLTQSKESVENKIRANPLTAMGIALGTGILLASLRK
jgi:ElaB/YqjD/DUF883 family membrane-anchored ribosome-binding protein